MPRPADPKRNAVIAAMIDLTNQYGIENGLAMARERFPGIPNETWARWRNAALGSNHADKAEADAVAKLATTPEIASVTPNPLPAMHRVPSIWKMLDELEIDYQLLRDYAVSKDENGNIRLKAPSALRDAHKLRFDSIRIAAAEAETLFNAESSAAFFQAIMEEIGAESLECQQRIIERLKRLQSSRLANTDAR